MAPYRQYIVWSSLAFHLLLSLARAQTFDEAKFNSVVAKVEADALEIARKVEELYRDRCSVALLSECAKSNYEHCRSSYPSESCPGGEDFNAPVCGDGVTCSALYSFEVTSVVIPRDLATGPDNNPTDPQVIETICFTQSLNQFIRDKRAADKAFWSTIGYEPSYMYFGSHNGAFRLSPATHYDSCNTYDPRIRPWYVAASSGPKNVIMVLDESGSMMENNKFEILKQAAKRVVNTATVGDRLAIVPFSTTATAITNEGFLYVMTQENKDLLVAEIDKLEAIGGTNFYAAFEQAFDILDVSIKNEAVVNCNTAILFLTDGKMTAPDGVDEAQVISMIEGRLAQASQNLDEPIYLFSYSVSGGDPQVDEFPRRLACTFGNGVWSKIEFEEDILDSLSSYYRFFALGLGAVSEDFTAWVEPYKYIPGDTLGTTVSAPVYDRSKTPHLFLGVAGVDFTLAALDAALGVTDSSSTESFRRVVQRSTVQCPRLEFTTCELESYRRQSIVGDEALCGGNCTEEDFVQIEEEQCATVSDYPNDLWINLDNEGLDYTEKACCRVGQGQPDETCLNDSDDTSEMWIVVVGALGGFICLAVVAGAALVVIRRKKRSDNNLNQGISNDDAKNDVAEKKSRAGGTSTTASPSSSQAIPVQSPNVARSSRGIPSHHHTLRVKDQCQDIDPEFLPGSRFPVVQAQFVSETKGSPMRKASTSES